MEGHGVRKYMGLTGFISPYESRSQGVKYHPSEKLVTLGLLFFGASWQIGECPPSIIQLCKLEWVDEFLTNTNWSWLKVLVVSSRSNRDVCRKMTCKTNPRDLAASIAAYLFFLRMTHTAMALFGRSKDGRKYIQIGPIRVMHWWFRWWINYDKSCWA